MILVMVVLIGVVLIVLVGIASLKLTAVAKEAYRLNEAFRILNVMEEVGQAVGKARLLGKSVDDGVIANCPSVAPNITTQFQTGTPLKTLCLPGTLASPSDFCIRHQDFLGATEDYCLAAVTILSKNMIDKNASELIVDVKPWVKHNWLSKIAANILINSSYAACTSTSSNFNWKCPHPTPTSPTPPGGYTPPPAVNPAPSTPVAPAPAPTAPPQGSSGPLQARATAEVWMPSATWGVTNEIHTPDCSGANQDSLGCMRCSNSKVSCVRINMCPPSNPGCSNPYVQKIAVY